LHNQFINKYILQNIRKINLNCSFDFSKQKSTLSSKSQSSPLSSLKEKCFSKNKKQKISGLWRIPYISNRFKRTTHNFTKSSGDYNFQYSLESSEEAIKNQNESLSIPDNIKTYKPANIISLKMKRSGRKLQNIACTLGRGFDYYT